MVAASRLFVAAFEGISIVPLGPPETIRTSRGLAEGLGSWIATALFQASIMATSPNKTGLPVGDSKYGPFQPMDELMSKLLFVVSGWGLRKSQRIWNRVDSVAIVVIPSSFNNLQSDQ